jgi:tripartite-type tricarboxylate transporter receptor subunit TctC
MIARRIFLAALLFLVALSAAVASAPPAAAQNYPSRVIRMITPFTPGSPVDVAARLLAQHLGSNLGQNVIVDNRPGAGTTTGMKAAAMAEPDGYTLLFQSSSLVVAPVMYKNLDYDPLKAFIPVANVASSHWVTVVPPSLPVRTVPELIAYARANPGKLNFGFGQGTAPQLVGEWLKVTNKLDIGSVPYRGGMQAVTDMLGGTIHLNIGTAATLVPLIHEGKLRAISVWGPRRFPELPDVPTMMESGFPGLSLWFWSGLWAPAGTPAAIVDKLNAATNAALRSPEMKASMDKLGIEATIGSPQDFAAFIAAEAPKWARIVEASGVKVD